MNWYGLYTLFAKETQRFMKVVVQTVLTPIITVLLYLVIFASVLQDHIEVYPNISYTQFLIPGLMMMSIIQNAFANTSSSLFQSKMQGSVVFMLISPLSNLEIFLAFVGAAVLRGVLVGIGVWLAALWFVSLPIFNVWAIISFTLLGSALLGALGLIASLISDKWDHISAFQNFVILPLVFLSGVFYSVDKLPGIWNQVSYYNPFFYMIDGFRYGFLGVSDINVLISLSIVSTFLVATVMACLWLLSTGYKLRY